MVFYCPTGDSILEGQYLMFFLRYIFILFLSFTSIASILADDIDPFKEFGTPKKVSSPSTIEGLIPSLALPGIAPSDTEVELISSPFYSPNKELQINLILTHAKGLHSYYRNPGTVGIPLEATLNAPEGFKVQGPYWSIPDIGLMDDDVYYGYSRPVLTWLVTPTDKAPDEATFTVTSSWQLCGDEGCLPPTEPAAFSVNLTKQKDDSAPSNKDTPPREAELNPATTGWNFNASKSPTGKNLILHISPPQETTLEDGDVYFFSDTGEIFPTRTQALHKTESGYDLTLPLNDGSKGLYPVLSSTGRLVGMLTFRQEEKIQGVLLDLPLSSEESIAPPSPTAPPQSLFHLFIALFIGGIILNLMPCVFPVIGLKVMGFVQMGGGHRRKIIIHSLTFVLGVLVSFWAITTLLLILKQSIPNINWAFWLEHPWVIFSLLIIMLVMGLSMFGVFEIGASIMGIGGKAQQKEGYMGSFYSGILCTVVATPCTAPFLGAAIGPAIALPPVWMFIAFTFMGLGMSLPYLILGIFPNLVQKLPKPGPWMETFKQALSFLLFATAAWLLWIYLAFYSMADPLLSLAMLFGLIIIALSAWIKGRWMLPYKTAKVRRTALVLAILLGLIGLFLSSPFPLTRSLEKQQSQETSSLIWEDWTPERQAEALEEGRPVYIDFTARWCATCLVNKSVAYTASVGKVIKDYNVLLLKADKTITSPAIDEELRRLGHSAVPVNVLYVPNDPEPKITNPILTPNYLETFLLEHLEK